MDWLVVNIFVCLIGVQLLVAMPIYFRKKNVRVARTAQYEEYVSNMLEQDKIYAQHSRQLNKNLNIMYIKIV